MSEIVLVRHGQTEWSLSGQHTSYTDLPLTRVGEEQSMRLRPLLAPRQFTAVLSSPRQRALRTAELAGLPAPTVDEDLAEWNYGSYEGLTSAQIQAEHPGWTIWKDGGGPGGETHEQVTVRYDRLLERVAKLMEEGDVALVAHGHALRAITARWIGLGVEYGALLALDTATVSALGYEHEQRVVRLWNETGVV